MWPLPLAPELTKPALAFCVDLRRYEEVAIPDLLTLICDSNHFVLFLREEARVLLELAVHCGCVTSNRTGRQTYFRLRRKGQTCIFCLTCT